MPWPSLAQPSTTAQANAATVDLLDPQPTNLEVIHELLPA